jgi:hypothetical protein
VRIRIARIQLICIAQVQFGLQGLSGKIDSISEAHFMSIYFISGFQFSQDANFGNFAIAIFATQISSIQTPTQKIGRQISFFSVA